MGLGITFESNSPSATVTKTWITGRYSKKLYFTRLSQKHIVRI